MRKQSSPLSKREKEVVELLLQGKSNKQIAFALGIAGSTVEFHLKNVYKKLGVSSRAEAILKLGKSTGLITENLRKSVVDVLDKRTDNDGNFILWKRWMSLIQETVSTIKKEVEMKNRLLMYFLGGLLFGAAYWHYLGITGRILSRISIDEENPLAIWLSLSTAFLIYFGVWLIPTILPTFYEFRRSRKINLSVAAVIMVWISAVVGYYTNYVALLAFVGLPHMEYYLIFGQQGPTFWRDWAELFPKLILLKLLKWTVIGTVVGGFAGLVTSSLYSFWIRKTNTILPS